MADTDDTSINFDDIWTKEPLPVTMIALALTKSGLISNVDFASLALACFTAEICTIDILQQSYLVTAACWFVTKPKFDRSECYKSRRHEIKIVNRNEHFVRG